jgi:hypothetical protein
LIEAVPAATPVTTPEALAEAIYDAELLHVPPATVLLNAVVAPTATEDAPLTVPAAGNEDTVIDLVAITPDTLYVMLAVPAATPETTPVEDTVATAVLLLLHAPPVVASVNAVVAP